MSEKYDKLPQVRLLAENAKRLREYKRRVKLSPTVPVIVNFAVSQWLDRQRELK